MGLDVTAYEALVLVEAVRPEATAEHHLNGKEGLIYIDNIPDREWASCGMQHGYYAPYGEQRSFRLGRNDGYEGYLRELEWFAKKLREADPRPLLNQVDFGAKEGFWGSEMCMESFDLHHSCSTLDIHEHFTRVGRNFWREFYHSLQIVSDKGALVFW